MKIKVNSNAHQILVDIVSWIIWPFGLANGNREYKIINKVFKY